MFGHSLGECDDRAEHGHDGRIKAGIDSDGHVIPTVSIYQTTAEQAAQLVG